MFTDICISDIYVISGVRPRGRTLDRMTKPRKNSGIAFLWNGKASFWEKGRKKTEAVEGDLLFLPKGCRYKMQYTAEETTFVLVNFEMFDKSGSDCSLSEHIELLAKDDAAKRIAKAMASMELCGTLQNPGAVFRKKELLYRILYLVYEDKAILSAEQKYPQIFEGALLLEQSFLENLPISRFAKASNISLSLFRQLFRKQYGTSPVQYRNRLRIQKAKAYLSEGSCTVSEAAYACGFENVGYFCRCYKKITGETPQETKKKKE